MINRVVLVGRLTKDVELRKTTTGLSVARFTVACDRRFSRAQDQGGNNQQTADFINCVAFGKLAEHVEKYYRKGLKTALTGRIQTRNYTNRDGQKVYVTEVVVEELEFAESKNAQGANGGYGSGGANYGGSGNGGNYGGSGSYGNAGGGYSAPAQNQSAAPASDTLDGFMNIPDGIDEELPFN